MNLSSFTSLLALLTLVIASAVFAVSEDPAVPAHASLTVPDGRTELGAERPFEAAPPAPEVAPATTADESFAATRLHVAPLSGRYGPQVPVEGRTATLAGVVQVGEVGARATLRFTAGLNRGAEFVTEDDGSYTWSDLYPGLGTLSVEAGYHCTRQVVLRHRKTDALAVHFGDHGVVTGRLVDEDGAPIAGAPLTLDGNPGTTDRDGWYELPRHAAGPAELVVRCPGYVAYRELLPAEADPQRPHVVELRCGRTVELRLGAVPAGDDALVWLRPLGAERTAGVTHRATFPWEELNPVRIPSHGVLRLDDLPPVKLEAHAVHPLAQARASGWPRRVTDEPLSLTLTLEPAATLDVRVVRDGEAVPGATVELSHPNLLSASLATWGGDARRQLKAQAIAILPSARQRTETGIDGSCRIGRDAVVKGEAYVTVTSPDGTLRVTREVERHEGTLVIDLAYPEA